MRTVSLVLVDPEGLVLGGLPPFEVAVPWWQEVGEIAERAGVQVLRLLHGDRPAPPGGHVTYLAETTETAASRSPRPVQSLRPVRVDLAPQPGRAAYAEVGGPAATLAWAGGEVARQQRTWNLSAIWRLDDRAGAAAGWVKQVPAFFAHEPAVLRLLGDLVPGLVPRLVAAGDQGRMLLAHIPGRDGYGEGAETCSRIVDAFHPVQEYFAGRRPAGVPDRHLDLGFARPFAGRIAGLARLLDEVPERLAEVAGCGLPDTLVHGDLHPGNVRIGGDGRLTIMDWGDCFVGNPALDVLRLTERLVDPEPVLERWAYRWRRSVPGSEPRRAAELIRPVAALVQAATYAAFLAAIEPAEHPYHLADVPERLTAAVQAARS